MRIKNLVVTNIIKSTVAIEENGYRLVELEYCLDNRICRKMNNGYLDLETNIFYHSYNKPGKDRVVKETVIPLSDYYNAFWFKKNTKHKNKEKVHEKVKSLRKARKI